MELGVGRIWLMMMIMMMMNEERGGGGARRMTRMTRSVVVSLKG